ncbi:hypothetical protein [Lysobacter capsici]|uniref:hypothetical protein n=1 Tax=Lysobacter capsici TaxID=435897 RepID=UPI00287BC163|nr:hypothetical protein [Lysobacter capsici]WND80484.1 hypothetical protein RJ610_24945 [Lysobacter capsici]WND85681.1 hypothetical protein RJ609_24965 [Lysobacter capsici]
MEAEAFKEWLGNPLSWAPITAILGWIAWGLLRALGGGLDAYAEKKGEHLATKEDFAELLAQVRENTRVTEKVRTEIAHEDWTAREWKGVRTRNLEALHAALHENYDYVQEVVRFYFHESGAHVDSSFRVPRVRLSTLQKLYYPELHASIALFQDRCDDLRILAINYSYTQANPSTPFLLAQAEELIMKFDVTDAELDVALEAASDAIAQFARDLFNAQPAMISPP